MPPAQPNVVISTNAASAKSSEEEFAVGRVVSVGKGTLNKELLSSVGMVSNRQIVSVEVLEGKLKGCTVAVPN